LKTTTPCVVVFLFGFGNVSNMKFLLFAVASSILLPNCTSAEPAPAELNAVSVFLWNRFNTNDGDDVELQNAEIRDGVKKLFAQLGPLDEPKSDLLDDPTAEMGDRVGFPSTQEQRDRAQGFYIANISGCTMEQNEDWALSTNADEVRADTYLEYSKQHAGDPDAFDNDQLDATSWSTTYKVQPLADPYTASIRGSIRRVDAANGSTDGTILMTQVVLTSPGVFEPSDAGSFPLDYQLEVYQVIDQKMHHFYGMWRNMQLGSFSAEGDLFIGTQLDGMLDWEKDADVTCSGDGPQPTR
jgi:hypothetical protein